MSKTEYTIITYSLIVTNSLGTQRRQIIESEKLSHILVEHSKQFTNEDNIKKILTGETKLLIQSKEKVVKCNIEEQELKDFIAENDVDSIIDEEDEKEDYDEDEDEDY